MTADGIPLQRTESDIDAVRTLTGQGVLGPTHRRWAEMEQVARELGLRPADAIYRVRDGIWSHQHDDHADIHTLADVIREAAAR